MITYEFKPVENYTNMSRVLPESGFNETGKEHKNLYALYKFSVTDMLCTTHNEPVADEFSPMGNCWE